MYLSRAFLTPLIAAALLFGGCSKSLSNMTTEQKAAKLIIVGVIGNSLNDENPIVRDIEQRGISGVILFENNINAVDSRAEMSRFIDDMQSRSTFPLFVAIDQEGGLVNRMKSKYGFADMPSQQSVGEVEMTEGAEAARERAREVSKMIAEEVSSVGINLNFSPCMDVNVNPDSPAIGRVNRSFSNDEERVAQLSKIYVDAHHAQGVLTSLKHFPGHGSAMVDSHLGLTDITSTWEARELVPYRELIGEGVCDMVMVSHLFHQDLDAEYPATLSEKIIDGLLRKELGWSGVVVSDDMQMKAITEHYGFEEAVTRGFNAGVDIFIISRKSNDEDIVGHFIEIIVGGVESGAIKMERLDEAVARIETLRNRLK